MWSYFFNLLEAAPACNESPLASRQRRQRRQRRRRRRR